MWGAQHQLMACIVRLALKWALCYCLSLFLSFIDGAFFGKVYCLLFLPRDIFLSSHSNFMLSGTDLQIPLPSSLPNILFFLFVISIFLYSNEEKNVKIHLDDTVCNLNLFYLVRQGNGAKTSSTQSDSLLSWVGKGKCSYLCIKLLATAKLETRCALEPCYLVMIYSYTDGLYCAVMPYAQQQQFHGSNLLQWL